MNRMQHKVNFLKQSLNMYVCMYVCPSYIHTYIYTYIYIYIYIYIKKNVEKYIDIYWVKCLKEQKKYGLKIKFWTYCEYVVFKMLHIYFQLKLQMAMMAYSTLSIAPKLGSTHHQILVNIKLSYRIYFINIYSSV